MALLDSLSKLFVSLLNVVLNAVLATRQIEGQAKRPDTESSITAALLPNINYITVINVFR